MTHVTDEDLGRLSRQWADLFERVRKGSVEVEYASRGLQLTKEHKLQRHESNLYALNINYGQSVEKALKAGKYDWTNKNLASQNFPSTRRGTDTVEVQLVHFGHTMTSDEVLEKLDKQGLRPATIEELLALGAQHPDLQRQFPIVALGSVWAGSRGSRGVPVLWGDDRGRDAGLDWLDFDWGSGDRFLAVRK